PVPDPFDAAIIEVEVCHLKFWCTWNPGCVSHHREAMVLGGDEDRSRAQVADRMVPAAMAIRHLGGAAAVGNPEELMAQADSEGGNAGVGQGADGGKGVLDGG